MSIADVYERYMLELINQERAAVGAPPLQLEQNLNLAADRHSLWMLEEDIFSHTGVGGSSATQRMRDANFDFAGNWRSAENIAVQSERGAEGIMDDVANLHTSLMNSPGHRANILNPDLDYIGIGIALGDFDYGSGTYSSVIVTQNFASTQGSVDLDLGEPTAGPIEEVQAVVEQASVQIVEDPVEEEAAEEGEPTTPMPSQAQPDVADETPAQQPEPVMVVVAPAPAPAPAATPETFAWSNVASGEVLDVLEALFDTDLPNDVDQGPAQSVHDVCIDYAQAQLEAFADLYRSLQSDDLGV